MWSRVTAPPRSERCAAVASPAACATSRCRAEGRWRPAIWLWDRPSKYMRSSTSRCASGSSSRAARTRRRSSGRPICSTTSSAWSAARVHRRWAVVLGSPAMRLLPADQVHGPVMDHPHQPRLHRSSASSYASGFRHSAMNASCTISSARWDCRTTRMREGLRGGRVAAEQPAERLLVTAADPLHQLAVASLSEVDGLHRLAPGNGRGSSDQRVRGDSS